jgi:hypothetical protein
MECSDIDDMTLHVPRIPSIIKLSAVVSSRSCKTQQIKNPTAEKPWQIVTTELTCFG